MFFTRRPGTTAKTTSSSASTMRPSQAYEKGWTRRHNDQRPFLSHSRFSALPNLQQEKQPCGDCSDPPLTLFVAILYVVDLFGVFPFVTLPGLLIRLNLIFGIPLVVSIICLQIYTSFLLSKCWTMAEFLDPSIVHKSRYPYAAIADLAYGRYTSRLVTILLDVSIFATAIPSLVMAAQNLELVGDRISDGKFSFSFCFWLLIIGLFICPLMWLGSPKHMRGLAIISLCVMIGIVVLLWFCLFAASPLGKPFQGINFEFPPFISILGGYSILAFQFDIHPMLLTLQIDMQHKSQVSWAAFSGIIITCTIAIFGSLIAAYKFGSLIAENLLESLPKSIPLFCLIILMAFQLCFSAIVGSSAMFLQIENYFRISEAFSFKRVLIRSTIVLLQVLIAEFVPDFDVLMDVIGGTITGPLVFILPPLLYRRISRMERLHQRIAAEATYGSLPLDLNYEENMSCNADVELEMSNLLCSDNSDEGISGDRATDPFYVGNDDDENERFNAASSVRRREYCFWRWLCNWRTWWLYARISYRRLQYEFSVPLLVLLFGVAATFLATYLNIFQITRMFRDNSCIGNLTQLF